MVWNQINESMSDLLRTSKSMFLAVKRDFKFKQILDSSCIAQGPEMF